MLFDADNKGLPFNPFKALVAPRPIGWLTTISDAGVVNLAPYSYFQAVADNPDIVMFSAAPQLEITENGMNFLDSGKDSQTNAASGGEFVCNMVSMDLVNAMNESSAHHPADISEPEFIGIEMTESTYVKPPRVKEAPAAIECVVVDTYTVQHRGGNHRYTMTFGEVVGIHIKDEFIKDGRVDTAAMQLVTRMGYDEYAVLEKAFSLSRPDNDPLLSGFVKS